MGIARKLDGLSKQGEKNLRQNWVGGNNDCFFSNVI